MDDNTNAPDDSEELYVVVTRTCHFGCPLTGTKENGDHVDDCPYILNGRIFSDDLPRWKAPQERLS